MGKIVGSILGGEKGKAAQAAPGGKFEPFTYTGLSGTAEGKRDGEGFNFSSELNPQLQALYSIHLILLSLLGSMVSSSLPTSSTASSRLCLLV